MLGATACSQHTPIDPSLKAAASQADVPRPVLAKKVVLSEFQLGIQALDSYRLLDELSLQVGPDEWLIAFLDLLDPYRDFMLKADVDVIMQVADDLYNKLLAGEPEALKSLYAVVNWRMATTINQAASWLRKAPTMRPKSIYHTPTAWAADESELKQRWQDKVFYFGLPDMVAGAKWKDVVQHSLQAYTQQQSCLQEFNNGKLMSYAIAAYAKLIGVDASYLSLDEKRQDKRQVNKQQAVGRLVGCDLPFILPAIQNRQLKSDTYPILAGGVATSIAVLTLPNFDGAITNNESLKTDIVSHLQQFQQNKVAGVVLDLRGNSGSSISDVTFVAEQMLGSGYLVQKKEFSGARSVVEYVGDRIYDGVLLMLIDRDTSGVAEVLVSAMQGRKRGIVIGERSNSSGQYRDTVYLRFGKLNIAAGEYMALAGHAIEDIGVAPDIELPFMKARVRQNVKSYVAALVKAFSVKPLLGQRYLLKAPLPYLRKQLQQRIDLSDMVPAYILMKRQQVNTREQRNVLDMHSQRRAHQKLLAAQTALAATGVTDVELFQTLQIVQDWIGVKNAGMRSW